MKKLFLIPAILFLFNTILFSQTFEWVKKEGSSQTRDLAKRSVFDASGNMYVIGTFGGLNSGTTMIGNVSLTSFGRTDVFLAKYDLNRKLLWVKQSGSTLYEYVYGLELDASGNVYISGIFSKSINNENAPMVFGSVTVNGYGKSDVFMAKYNSNGDLVWAKSFGSTDDDQLNSMCIDGSENLLITGGYKSTITFGNTTLTNNTGHYQTFICRFNGNGDFSWIKNASGTSTNIGVDISCDVSGNSVLTGFFGGSMTIDNITNTSSGDYDIFYAKVRNNGDLLWFKKAGGIEFDYGLKIDIANDGCIIITGSFQSVVNFNNNITLAANGGTDVFVCKLDENGNTLWVKDAYTYSDKPGFLGDISPSDAIFDSNGSIYLTGYFVGNVVFDNDTLYRAPAGLSDIYFVKYKADGSIDFLKQIYSGGTSFASYSFSHTLSKDFNNNIYINGSFMGRASFDNITLDAEGDLDDSFIAKLSLSPTSVNQNSIDIPEQFFLEQNYPNPFNPSTVISYIVTSDVKRKTSNVKLIVHDNLGKQVNILVDEFQVAGSYSVKFDGTDYPSGIYFYTLAINGSIVNTKVMTLIK